MITTQLIQETTQPTRVERILRKPMLGFLGTGWIGRHRLEAVAQADLAEIVAISDPAPAHAQEALQLAPGAKTVASLEEMLEMKPDGIVIATPSALHADQAETALEHGVSVFCQKPLGRNARETRRVIDAARAADRLLAVDLSYRHVTEIQKIYDLIRQGELGNVYAAELVFHNAYGPDKNWYYDRRLSGGGCVIDLGIHLVDLGLWMLGFPRVVNVSSRLYAQGSPVRVIDRGVEDYAVGRLDLNTGACLQIACSWNLPAGYDAVIGGTFYGTRGAAQFSNVDGSFYHFKSERLTGPRRESLAQTGEPWGGRAVTAWAGRLGTDASFDPEIETLNPVAEALDAICGS